MSFEKLLCAILALYGLLNFVIQPRLTKGWNASRVVSRTAKAGLLGAVQFARDTVFIAALVYLAFGLLTASLGFGFGHNVRILEWLVGSASHLHEFLKTIQDFWSDWFFLFPLALIVYLQWLTQRNRFSGNFERTVDEELDRLNEQRALDPRHWAALAPNENMLALDEQIDKAKAKLATLAPHGPQDRMERRRLLRLVSQLGEQRSELDYERRINTDPLNIPEGQPDRRPAWQRILLSKGLFSDLKGFSKLLSRLTLAMLSVALIGVAGTSGLTDDVWDRLVRLDDLRVNARKVEIKEAWDGHGKKPQQALSDSDRQAINHLANDFARALTRNPNWQPLRAEVRMNGSLERGLGRRAVLSEVRLPRADGRDEAAFADGLSVPEREVLKEVVSGDRNSSRVGRIVADRHGVEIKSWFGDRWESTKAAIIEHAKTYYEPIEMEDLQGELIDRVVAAAFDAGADEKASDFMKQAYDGMSDSTKEAAREAVETELHQVMEDLDSGKSYTETIEKVRHADIPVSKRSVDDLAMLMHDRKLPDTRDFAERMASNPGEWKDPGSGGFGPVPQSAAGSSASTGPQPKSGPGGAASADAETIVSEIAKEETGNGKYSLPEEEVGALAEYEDHFPRSVASQAETVLGKTLARYRPEGEAQAFAKLAALNVERAASFSMLRGFSKVGGVLVGQAPRGMADIRDIRWALAGQNVTLTLVDGTGRQSLFGPFNKGLVHQSLAYAADGRPVAVTMTIAKPVPTLKIFLHPSLVDTPLGCRVQELDRLVDTYARTQLPEREKMTEQYYAQVAVYNVALAERREAIAEKANADKIKQGAEILVNANAAMAAQGLRQPGLYSSESILHRKPEFFDPSLIRTAKNCQTQDLQAFETCVVETYRKSRIVREFKEDELRSWMIPPTGMQPWSGVRERGYVIGNDLDFLRPPAGSGVEARLWPFDFIVQIAFTSGAINLPEKQQEKYVDRQPIEFDEIKPKIEALVNSGIDTHGFRPQFEDLRNFAILQRLFRAALNGNLGSGFPVLKLAQLTDATKGGAPYFHTKRWNNSEMAAVAELMKTASSPANAPQPWMKRAALKLPQCRFALARTFATASDQGSPAACSFEEFKSEARKACPKGSDRNSPGCIWAQVVASGEELAPLQEIELAFGVIDDQRQNSAVDCPSLAVPSISLTMKR